MISPLGGVIPSIRARRAFMSVRFTGDSLTIHCLPAAPPPTLLLAAIGIGRLIATRSQVIAVWPCLRCLGLRRWSATSRYASSRPYCLVIAIAGGGRTPWSIDHPPSSLNDRLGRLGLGRRAVWQLRRAETRPITSLIQPADLDRDRDVDVLVDSNLDWGQDLISLREWVQAQNLDAIGLAYFGTARPEAYDVQTDLLPSFTLNEFGPEVSGFSAYALPPGWYAISATSLQLGLLYSHWDMYAPFRDRAPDARIGRSLLAYRVDYPSSEEVDRTVVLARRQATRSGDARRHPDRHLILKWAGAMLPCSTWWGAPATSTRRRADRRFARTSTLRSW
jgi:hypothetical protein